MKLKHVLGLSVLGMALSSASVYAVSGNGDSGVASTWGGLSADAATTSRGSFTSAGTLVTEARLGHAQLATDGVASTFVSLEVRGSDKIPSERPPLHMALVIDRSGSMNGDRLTNAIRAANGVVDRMADGDRVTVVSFDQESKLVVPTITLGSHSRASVRDALGRIELGGSTCISCGLDDALRELERAAGDALQRVLVLSDGAANHGIRDVEGFRRMAQMCRQKGVPVTTVGLGLDYNEKILAALAFESHGRHHFVENDQGLLRVFDAETKDALTLVATGASVTIDLAPGVELVRVVDRMATSSGRRVEVPLGTFAPGESKTVLLEIRVPITELGPRAVAGVSISFRDLVEGRAGRVDGQLAVVGAEKSDSLDPVVAARLERSLTSRALEEANELAKQGDFTAANTKLQQRVRDLRSSAEKAKDDATKKGVTVPGRVDADLERQVQAADEAARSFDPASPAASAAPERQRAVRKNQEVANDMFE